ncbi:MAG: hypothetical protein HYU67_01920 [Flavobacteriia bacterium]|nr:hypothetical protein [Flavobacteriia bacterium]
MQKVKSTNLYLNLFFFILLFSFFLISCQSNTTNTKKVKDQKNKINNLSQEIDKPSIEDKLKQQIYSVLNIDKNEKIDLKIYFEQLNDDNIKDAIVTVNRLEKAIEHASINKHTAKRAELGFLGGFNYFFFYDGKNDRLSIPVVIASSAKAPLKVEFLQLENNSYKNISIEYKIRNSAFKNFYLLNKNELRLVFQWKMYDKIGLEEYEAYFLEMKKGNYSLVNDIYIYKGIISNYKKNIEDVYKYQPNIINSKELYYHFFFDPNKWKYVTQDKPKTTL